MNLKLNLAKGAIYGCRIVLEAVPSVDAKNCELLWNYPNQISVDPRLESTCTCSLHNKLGGYCVIFVTDSNLIVLT